MIRKVHYGNHTFEPWYQNPSYVDISSKSLKSYRCKEPASLWQSLNDENREISLFVCPKCFLYSSLKKDTENHVPFCRFKKNHPGTLVYSSELYDLYRLETTNSSDKLYMQSVSLFGRLFLETKSICFALEGFWIYVLVDKQSDLVAGFFSKEKAPWHNYNLACIVVFPPFQKRGLAHLMIDYSYYLTREACTTEGPEQPLSTHGQRAYLAYWAEVVGSKLEDAPSTLDAISSVTGIDTGDVIACLRHMNALETFDGAPSINLERVREYRSAHPFRRLFDRRCVVE